MIGNTLGLDAESDTIPGARGTIGTFIANPLAHASVIDGSYPSGTTNRADQNGSAAHLDLPNNARIAHATLVWACSSQTGGTPTTPVTSPPAVQLIPPNGVQQSIAPQGETDSIALRASGHRLYQRWADVTDHVRSGGAGRYIVSGVAGTQVTSNQDVSTCGWGLFVAFSHAEMPRRHVAIHASVATIAGGDAPGCPCEASADLGPFCMDGAQTAKLMVLAAEGDALSSGDMLAVQRTSGELYPLSGPNNAWDNFFASQINRGDGSLDTRGTFGGLNHLINPEDGDDVILQSGARQGWDVTTVPLDDAVFNPNVLTHGQTSLHVRAISENDDLVLVGLGLAIDAAPLSSTVCP